MTARRDWPKPDLLQQRRLELGWPSQPPAVEPLPLLLLKGAVLGVALLVIPIASVLFFENQQRHLEDEVLELASVEARVGGIQAKLRTMTNERVALKQQTDRIAAQLVALRS